MSAIDIAALRASVTGALTADLQRQADVALERAHEAMARHAVASSDSDRAWQLQTACEALKAHDEAVSRLKGLGGGR